LLLNLQKLYPEINVTLNTAKYDTHHFCTNFHNIMIVYKYSFIRI